MVVEYKYNAWGTLLSRTGSMAQSLGYRNPFRYRGYIYDDETWMYWVKSRYYYPELHRFINADDIDNVGRSPALLECNLYAYCANQPITYCDPQGEALISCLLGCVVSAVVNVATTAIAAAVTKQKYTWKDGLVAAASGFVNGIGRIGKVISGLISGGYTFKQAKSNGFSTEQALACGLTSGVATSLSIGNLAYLGKIDAGILANAGVDLVFGTGYNSVSAAVYAGTQIDVDRANRSKTAYDHSTEAARKEKIAQKKTNPLRSYGGYRNMQAELSFM